MPQVARHRGRGAHPDQGVLMARLAIRMPKMSMTMTEGEVSSWLVKVGDEITDGDVVCEVMTDKVDMEVESTVSGTLVEIVVESGTVAVGEPIGWVEGEDDGGGFGDLLTAPETRRTRSSRTRSRAATPRPSRGQPRRSPSSCARAASCRPSPAPAAWPASWASTWPRSAVRPRGAGARRGRRRRWRRRTQPAPRRAAGQPLPRRRRGEPRSLPAKQTDRRAAIRAVVARTMTPSAAIPQFTVWRELAPRRRQRAPATACPGPRSCCARTPRRCARCPSC